MERTAGRFDVETNAQASNKANSRRRGKRATAAAKKQAVADQARRVEYEALGVSLRNEIRPTGVLEKIYVDRLIAAAWRFREAIESEQTGIFNGLGGVDSGDIFDQLADDLRRQTDRAERGLRRSFESLAHLQQATKSVGWGKAIKLDGRAVEVAPIEPTDEEILPNEWTIVPFEEEIEPKPSSDPNAPLPRWQDRLVFDTNISERSPVVRGTWITVSQIVTLVVDGYTWADILRSHPELTEEDIRICLSYATSQDCDGSDNG